MPHVDYAEFASIAAAAQAGLTALGKAVDDSGLDKGLTEIVKLRASQINGCAFCIQYHLNVARKLGVPARKLDLVAAWRDAGVYSDREMAALAWTEALTGLAGSPPDEHSFAALTQQFTKTEAVFLTTAIATINAWNRISAGLGFAPPA